MLANMLMESEVNPFDGQEAKPYISAPYGIHHILLILLALLMYPNISICVSGVQCMHMCLSHLF